ncbi:hypothetical protein [Psychromonas sp. MME2]|uniref:hypothetical protein n=1 Tax=Psychromonas sp. MME2 TaxID=3231033 RepID=UPI00339BE3DC
MPIVDESPQLHLFFHELLETAITEIGQTPQLISTRLPQRRIKSYLDQGLISIYWAIEHDEEDKKYIPIKVGLTAGLIGQRILLIKNGDQNIYSKVDDLDSFRELGLVAGMGKDWFDISVWKANKLLYKEAHGNWKSIFKMIPYGRDYNYISRGINEILVEAEEYDDLQIESKLVLIYNRDFQFYLSKNGVNSGEKYQQIIELAIKNAQKSGLIDRLVNKYWGDAFKRLNYENRVKIYLQTPEA